MTGTATPFRSILWFRSCCGRLVLKGRLPKYSEATTSSLQAEIVSCAWNFENPHRLSIHYTNALLAYLPRLNISSAPVDLRRGAEDFISHGLVGTSSIWLDMSRSGVHVSMSKVLRSGYQ